MASMPSIAASADPASPTGVMDAYDTFGRAAEARAYGVCSVQQRQITVIYFV